MGREREIGFRIKQEISKLIKRKEVGGRDEFSLDSRRELVLRGCLVSLNLGGDNNKLEEANRFLSHDYPLSIFVHPHSELPQRGHLGNTEVAVNRGLFVQSIGEKWHDKFRLISDFNADLTNPKKFGVKAISDVEAVVGTVADYMRVVEKLKGLPKRIYRSGVVKQDLDVIMHTVNKQYIITSTPYGVGEGWAAVNFRDEGMDVVQVRKETAGFGEYAVFPLIVPKHQKSEDI